MENILKLCNDQLLLARQSKAQKYTKKNPKTFYFRFLDVPKIIEEVKIKGKKKLFLEGRKNLFDFKELKS